MNWLVCFEVILAAEVYAAVYVNASLKKNLQHMQTFILLIYVNVLQLATTVKQCFSAMPYYSTTRLTVLKNVL